MRHYVYKFIIVSILFVLLLTAEKIWNDDNNELIDVVVTSQNIEKGTIIDESKVKYIKVQKTEISDNLVMNIKDIIGKFASESMLTNQYLYEFQFIEKNEYDLEENERMITVKFSIEESNGWHITKGQTVDLIMINEKDLSEIILENIKVEKIFNDQLYEIENPFIGEVVPQYASFIINKTQLSLYLKNNYNFRAYISVK